MEPKDNKNSTLVSRRRFVQGAIAGGVLAGLDVWRIPAFAAVAAQRQAELRGNSFQLAVEQIAVNFTGKPGYATAVNGTVPAPVLRWREGDTVTIALTNRLRNQPASIHWHGVRTPSDMDGVPGLSFPGVAPGETFVYRFPVRQHGT